MPLHTAPRLRRGKKEVGCPEPGSSGCPRSPVDPPVCSSNLLPDKPTNKRCACGPATSHIVCAVAKAVRPDAAFPVVRCRASHPWKAGMASNASSTVCSRYTLLRWPVFPVGEALRPKLTLTRLTPAPFFVGDSHFERFWPLLKNYRCPAFFLKKLSLAPQRAVGGKRSSALPPCGSSTRTLLATKTGAGTNTFINVPRESPAPYPVTIPGQSLPPFVGVPMWFPAGVGEEFGKRFERNTVAMIGARDPQRGRRRKQCPVVCEKKNPRAIFPYDSRPSF